MTCKICGKKHKASEEECERAKKLVDMLTAPPPEGKIPDPPICDNCGAMMYKNGDGWACLNCRLETITYDLEGGRKQAPMGVSEWRAYGEKLGYWQYFEEQVRATYLKLIEDSCVCKNTMGFEECVSVCFKEAVRRIKGE
jgi:hypothetical protein